MNKKVVCGLAVAAGAIVIAVAVLLFAGGSQQRTRTKLLTEFLPRLLTFPNAPIAAVNEAAMQPPESEEELQQATASLEEALQQAIALLAEGNLTEEQLTNMGSSFRQTVVMTHLQAAMSGYSCLPGQVTISPPSEDNSSYFYTVAVTVTLADGTPQAGEITGRVQFEEDSNLIRFLSAEGDVIKQLNRPAGF